MEQTPAKRARSEKPKKPRGKKSVNETQEQTEKVEKQVAYHYALAPMVHFWTGRSVLYASKHAHQDILQLPLQPGVLTSESLLDHFRASKPWQVELPLPLYTAPGSGGPTIPDAMVRSLVAKKTYNRRLTTAQEVYRKSKSKRRAIDLGRTSVNSAALLYAALLDRDPDPYLRNHADYDYHYTGGCCAWLRASTKDRAILFKAVGDRLEQLEILQLRSSSGDVDGLQTERIQLLMLPETGGSILEITTNQRGLLAHDSSIRIAVRKRNRIIIVRAIQDETAGSSSWQVCQSIQSSVPFASVCFVGPPAAPLRHPDALCTTDYQRLLRLWTLDRSNGHDEAGEMQCVKQLTLPQESSTSDDWSTVRCVNNAALVACLDRRMLHLYRIVAQESNGYCDSYTPSPAEIHDGSALHFESCGQQTFSQWTYPCERACALEVAPDDKLIFIATCHHLLVAQLEPHTKDGETDLDGRPSDSADASSDKHLRLVVLIVYAHHLQQRPAFLSFQCHSFDDTGQRAPEWFVLLASHLGMCYCLCSFTKRSTDDRYVAHQYPYHPRTFAESYRVAQRHGYCLGASEPLKRRFSAYHSGALLVPFRQRLVILLQNSCGDLLQQAIVPAPNEPVKSETSVAETIRMWDERLLVEQLASTENGHLPYTASDFRKLTKFRRIFNCPDSKTSTLSEQLFRRTTVAKGKRNDSFRSKASHYSSDDTAGSMNGDDDGDESDGASGVVAKQQKAPTEQTIEELRSYKDILVQPLLSVWGYGDTVLTTGVVVPQAEQIPVQLPGYDELHVTERIACWMSSANEEPSVKEEAEEIGIVKVERQENDEKKLNVDLSYLRENGVAEHADTDQHIMFSQDAVTMATTQNGEETVFSQPTVAPAAKKRKYVKGF